MPESKNSEQPIPNDIAALSFEEALKSLEEIVRGLEKGDTSLDQAIQVYERGNALRRHCAEKLEQAKARIEKIQVQHGSINAVAFDQKNDQ